MTPSLRARSVVLVFTAMIACGSPSESPEPGFETGPCIDGSCLGGLVCQSDVCVVPAGSEGADATTVGGTTPSTADTADDATTTSSTTSSSSTAAVDSTTTAAASTDTGAPSESSSSSGEPAADYALQFDGPNRGTSEGPIALAGPEYTVEAWFELLDLEAHGAIIDHQIMQTGYLLTVVPGSLDLVFTVWMGQGTFTSAVAGSTAEVGVGWHHVAATTFEGSLTIHLDGMAMDTVPLTGVTSVNCPIALGYTPDLPAWNLTGLVLDDVRITAEARYTQDFVPPTTFVDDGNVLVVLDFDEGAGVSAADAANGTLFGLEQPIWVVGYP